MFSAFWGNGARLEWVLDALLNDSGSMFDHVNKIHAYRVSMHQSMSGNWQCEIRSTFWLEYQIVYTFCIVIIHVFSGLLWYLL